MINEHFKWIYEKLLYKSAGEVLWAFAQNPIRDVVLGNNFIKKYRKVVKSTNIIDNM